MHIPPCKSSHRQPRLTIGEAAALNKPFSVNIISKFLIIFLFFLSMTYPGGVGTLAYALCQYNPQMKITVCDLQPVVSLTHHFRPSVEDCPNQVNVSFMIGDFFKPKTLPKADLYVLSRILHDWPEEKVEVILDNVFNCLPSGKTENTAANIESLAT